MAIFLKKMKIFGNFFLKKCQVFGNFLTVKWQFSGGSDVNSANTDGLLFIITLLYLNTFEIMLLNPTRVMKCDDLTHHWLFVTSHRWWENKCPDVNSANTDETSELQIENVAGVFFILVGGIILASVVCLGEYFAHALINASKLVNFSTQIKSFCCGFTGILLIGAGM